MVAESRHVTRAGWVVITSSECDDGRGHREVQLGAVLLGDLGTDRGCLLAHRVSEVRSAERHDYPIPQINHGASTA
jgi:hypothetical protein